MNEPLEQREIEVRFIPITCAAPLLHAQTGGFFERNGLVVHLRPAPGWSGVKELLVHGRVDAAHMLSPMPFASTLGADGRPAELRLGLIQNVSGQALTVARRHDGAREARDMRGFVFGVPYLYSIQYYLLCDWLARQGLDPRTDASIVEVAPPLMPYHMRRGELDAMLAPEPYNEIAVLEGTGRVLAFSSELWPGHPCCAFATTEAFIASHPSTWRALVRSIVEAQRDLHLAGEDRRAAISAEISELAGWRGARAEAVARVLAGVHLDERGGARAVPRRIDFLPYPTPGVGIWILSQMQRWGQLPPDLDIQAAVDRVFRTQIAQELSEAEGLPTIDPAAAGLWPTSAEGALAAVQEQPFCALRRERLPQRRDELPEAARARVEAMLQWLAGVVGGETGSPIEVASSDELGWLERMLNEAVLNAQFARESLAERLELEEQSIRQQAIIAAQQALIRELSTPVLPVLPGVLVLPIVGRVDEARAAALLTSLLAAAERSAAELLILDVTGATELGAAALSHIVRMVRGAGLLGARCLLVGVRPEVARGLIELEAELPELETARDLQSGIALALAREERRTTAVRLRRRG